MREFNEFILARLAEDPIKSYTLMFIDIKDQPLYLTTLPYDLDFDGNTYLKDAGVIDYSTPIQSSNVNKQSFSIVVIDNQSAFKNSIQRTAAGRDAKMYLGFFNPDGTPNTDPENVIVTYEGFIDSTSYSNDFSEAVFSFELSSPMADLSLVNTLVTSPDGMDQVSATDTSFDNILVDNESILKWGKK